MFICHYFVLACLIQYILTIEINPKNTNIRGKKVDPPQKTIHNYDYRKYYKDLFQSVDVHPKLYGNNATNAHKNAVRENFNDDVEHDKHALVFQHVYNAYKRVLDRRKAELNKTRKIQKSKDKMNAHVHNLEKAMIKKLQRVDYLNHKQIIKERKDDKENKNDDINALNGNITQDKSKDQARVMDVLKVKNLLSNVENYVHNKVEKCDQQKPDKRAESHMGHIENKNASHEPIRNDLKTDLKGKIKNFFGFNKDSSSRKSTRMTKTTTRRPTTPDLIAFALNNTEDDDSDDVTFKGKSVIKLLYN